MPCTGGFFFLDDNFVVFDGENSARANGIAISNDISEVILVNGQSASVRKFLHCNDYYLVSIV